MWRVILGVIVGGGLSILIAANWPDPNSKIAGVVIGYVGTMIGLVLGMIWEYHARR